MPKIQKGKQLSFRIFHEAAVGEDHFVADTQINLDQVKNGQNGNKAIWVSTTKCNVFRCQVLLISSMLWQSACISPHCMN